MPAIKVTKKGIDALVGKPHPKRIDYFDTAHKGLCITIGPRGGVWYYFRRIDGKLNRQRLGPWPDMGIKAARDAAGKVEEDIEQGKHPKAEQARQRAEKTESRKQDQQRLIEKLAKTWSGLHLPGLAESTQRDYRHLLGEFVEAFTGRDVATIRRGELTQHLNAVKTRSASQANRAAVIIRQMFQHAQDTFDLPINAAAGLKNPTKPVRRKRTLDRREIRVLWRALELAGYPYGHMLKMALCTGQRIGEIGFMRWADLEGNYWANKETKTDERIDIFIADHAAQVLRYCPRIGDFCFTHGKTGIRSDTLGGGKTGAMSRHIRPMIEAAALELGTDPIEDNFTAHDLRRTVRTGLTGWAAVVPDTAERVLNHSITGIRANYDWADYKPHVTGALKAWDRELDLILFGLPSYYELSEEKKKTDKQIDALIKKARKAQQSNVTPIRRASA